MSAVDIIPTEDYGSLPNAVMVTIMKFTRHKLKKKKKGNGSSIYSLIILLTTF